MARTDVCVYNPDPTYSLTCPAYYAGASDSQGVPNYPKWIFGSGNDEPTVSAGGDKGKRPISLTGVDSSILGNRLEVGADNTIQVRSLTLAQGYGWVLRLNYDAAWNFGATLMDGGKKAGSAIGSTLYDGFWTTVQYAESFWKSKDAEPMAKEIDKYKAVAEEIAKEDAINESNQERGYNATDYFLPALTQALDGISWDYPKDYFTYIDLLEYFKSKSVDFFYPYELGPAIAKYLNNQSQELVARTDSKTINDNNIPDLIFEQMAPERRQNCSQINAEKSIVPFFKKLVEIYINKLHESIGSFNLIKAAYQKISANSATAEYDYVSLQIALYQMMENSKCRSCLDQLDDPTELGPVIAEYLKKLSLSDRDILYAIYKEISPERQRYLPHADEVVAYVKEVAEHYKNNLQKKFSDADFTALRKSVYRVVKRTKGEHHMDLVMIEAHKYIDHREDLGKSEYASILPEIYKLYDFYKAKAHDSAYSWSILAQALHEIKKDDRIRKVLLYRYRDYIQINDKYISTPEDFLSFFRMH